MPSKPNIGSVLDAVLWHVIESTEYEANKGSSSPSDIERFLSAKQAMFGSDKGGPRIKYSRDILATVKHAMKTKNLCRTDAAREIYQRWKSNGDDRLKHLNVSSEQQFIERVVKLLKPNPNEVKDQEVITYIESDHEQKLSAVMECFTKHWP